MAKITITNAGTCVEPVIKKAQFATNPAPPFNSNLEIHFAPNSFNAPCVANIQYSNTGGTSWTLIGIVNITNSNLPLMGAFNIPLDVTPASLIRINTYSETCFTKNSNAINPIY